MPVIRTVQLLALALLVTFGCARDVPQLSPLPEGAVILAFGDSLTYGTGAAREESYPSVLESLSGHTVINAGVPGERTPEGLRRLPQTLERYRPALMVLCHGGNDMLRKQSAANMQANLEAMIRMARDKGVQVVLLGVPRPALFGLESAAPYYAVAEQTGVPLEESVIPEVLSDSDLKSDQIHPNAQGYRLIAEAVHALLQREGALSP